ncbi:bifunctional nuclease family protein [Planctomycetota bacterium]|nr:bifunctional nuclease family protein [Planctomycetota bacterium]
MTLVPFSLARIVLSNTEQTQKVVLREINGDRHFAIDIGDPEAIAIYRRAEQRQHERPLTHDLVDNVLAGMGGSLKGVEITDLKDRTYHANLLVDTPDGEVRIDARPSDALALLVGAGVELFVDDEKVLAPLYGEDL